jgi:hypothetical protein
LLQWLEHPAVQAGVLPFVVALAVVLLTARGRASWLAPTVAYLTTLVLTTGISFTPLSASRRVLLLALLAPLAGALADRLPRVRLLLPMVAGALAVWAFWTVLVQRDAATAAVTGLGIAAFVWAACWLTFRLRADGPALGAAGLGLGLATGIAALLSASTGYFAAGIALAAGSGALLLVQFATGRPIGGSGIGAAGIGVAASLFAAGTLMLAQLPWTALPLLLGVPAAVSIPVLRGRLPPRARIVALAAVALLAAVPPVLVAWAASAASG